MSSFLYVVYSAPASHELIERELHPFVVQRSTGRVLNNALQGLRCNVTTHEEEVFVEPFIAGASFQALRRNSKKHSILVVFLEAMFEWASTRGWRARLVTIKCRPRRPDESVTFDSLSEFWKMSAPLAKPRK